MTALLLLAGIALGDEVTQPGEPSPKRYQVAALPIANYSSNTGIGYGGFGAVVRNEEPGAEDPYRWRAALQVFFTTGRYQDHNVVLDDPSVAGSPYRWDLLLGYEAWQEAPWFGVGNDLPRLPHDATPEGYYQYDVRWARALTNVRRNIHGPWDVFGQYLFRFAAIEVYEDSLLDLHDPTGVEGGAYARLGAGLMYDTRDAEPSPTEGTFSEGSLRVSAPVLGSRYTVVGLNLVDRRWVSLDRGHRLVFANRVVFDARRGDEPFFASPLLGGSQFWEIGAANNLRGVPSGRYRGDVVVLWTPELRWLALRPGPFDLWLVPFFDAGRVFLWPDTRGDAVADGPLHLHYSGGLGLRVQVGQSMLIRADSAFAAEEFLVDGQVVTRPQFGFYLVFGHPF